MARISPRDNLGRLPAVESAVETTDKVLVVTPAGTRQATIAELPVPTAVQAAIDAAVAGLAWKASVRVATTAPGTLATSFANGQTVDGVVLATGDRLLVKDQASAAENGIYVVAAAGAPARAADANTAAELLQAACYVREGTANADTQWVLTTDGPLTVGTTGLTFTQFGVGGGGGGGGGGGLPPFAFEQAYNAVLPPGSGKYFVQTGPDQLIIDKRDADGNDWSGLLDAVAPGWLVHVYDPDAPTANYAILTVATATLDTDTYTLVGTFIESAGDITAIDSAVVAFNAGPLVQSANWPATQVLVDGADPELNLTDTDSGKVYVFHHTGTAVVNLPPPAAGLAFRLVKPGDGANDIDVMHSSLRSTQNPSAGGVDGFTIGVNTLCCAYLEAVIGHDGTYYIWILSVDQYNSTQPTPIGGV